MRTAYLRWKCRYNVNLIYRGRQSNQTYKCTLHSTLCSCHKVGALGLVKPSIDFYCHKIPICRVIYFQTATLHGRFTLLKFLFAGAASLFQPSCHIDEIGSINHTNKSQICVEIPVSKRFVVVISRLPKNFTILS